MSSPTVPPVTVPALRKRKRRLGAEPIAMLTAYDAPGARVADAGGVDVVLVGDSVGDNVLGYDDTLHVTMEDMVRHVGAVARARPRALVVGDLPWMSYHRSVDEAVANAARMVRAGAAAVKLEGGRSRVRAIEAIVDAQIPVMGHLGLTPQSVLAMGGYRMQAKSPEAARSLLDAAKALEAAGCFAVVLEGVPDEVAAEVTATLDVPTIGIGAGPACDGQVLVFHDLLGLGTRPPPRFARRYARLAEVATAAVAAYVADVRSGGFPGPEESHPASLELRRSLEGVEEPAPRAEAPADGPAGRLG